MCDFAGGGESGGVGERDGVLVGVGSAVARDLSRFRLRTRRTRFLRTFFTFLVGGTGVIGVLSNENSSLESLRAGEARAGSSRFTAAAAGDGSDFTNCFGVSVPLSIDDVDECDDERLNS